MQKINWRKFFSNPTHIGLVLIGLLLSIVVVSLVFGRNKKSTTQISEDQIQIVKGEEIITINQNGLVEYRSKDKVYSEYWDASQINSFFSLMEQKARNYLTHKVSGGDCGYKVFMYLDGKSVTVCVDSNDGEVADIVEPILIKYSDINVSDLFGNGDDDEDGGDDEFSGVVDFPTSTPTVASIVTPTPTPYSVYNTNTNYAPVKADCDTWSSSIVKNRAIISNTFCTVNTTPTPVP
ncbi:MAG: hypothetical protein UT39_C0004G0009 [Candidatus Woesebacteria bacterium GW2011_GWA1_39_21]|uniref:Uncharacterized protein n=1 Tax=Candidatus Woesebacteria bacterium GW2011_GWA1_39_21 TaxID=1618550 RepID=A0A0G0QMR1_9BACT|nr:MAG: hypothetical protein UT39_C0004G0009 [Candidatus Woesebacteria bacterium GW2011_GWA1_39_21]